MVDVLLGMTNERIVQNGHDVISTFGIGTEYEARKWRALLRQLIALRFIEVDVTGHGGLSISTKGREFLRKKRIIMLRVPDLAPPKTRYKTNGGERENNSMVRDIDRDLFQALRQKRSDIARLQNLPPNIIFHVIKINHEYK